MASRSTSHCADVHRVTICSLLPASTATLPGQRAAARCPPRHHLHLLSASTATLPGQLAAARCLPRHHLHLLPASTATLPGQRAAASDRRRGTRAASSRGSVSRRNRSRRRSRCRRNWLTSPRFPGEPVRLSYLPVVSRELGYRGKLLS